jgi:signal transduction histidine kinase
MTPLPGRPEHAPPLTSVARTLYDIAQGFDWPLDPEPRLRRALRLLRRIVPYDRCGLLHAPGVGVSRLMVEPDAVEERDGVSRILTRFLTLLTEEAHPAGDRPRPDGALLPLWASASHLAVPLVGLDRVLGVLFVRGTDVYTDDHLRLLSVVAAQIAAYLTAGRLREQEAQSVIEHAEAQAIADAQSRVKGDFLAILVRELRKLLAPARDGMETIRTQAQGEPSVRRATEVVERQLDDATRLLDDVLDVSCLGSDKIALHKELVSLQTIVTAAVESTRHLADARRHRLSVLLPQTPLWIEADAARLSRAVGSLLDNAAKFTRPGGDISVTADREDGDFVLRVRDTGVGLSPEMLPLVFDLCARAQRSLPYADEGIGLGLTLARILVEHHGGRISAHSEGLGKGSEFVVRLPGA